METLVSRLTQLLSIAGFIALVLGVILKLADADWLAYASGWFRFATACGIVAIAGKICWPAKEAA
jgi:hypothetical protein